ncbi:MAG: MBL fold metallo-hydrolase [Clostridia bacterium]|nr:MBL fold metallo-hydrolase [Clostridia bacterium]
MKKFKPGIAVLLAVVCLIVGAVGGFIGYGEVNGFESDVYVSGDLQIHFLELGNKYTGDCTFIKAGDTDILIDAGSKTSSIPYISAYIDKYVTDGKLEYVIVTHAHQDHYAGFATNENTSSLFDMYVCENIIDFARTNQKPDATMYSNYVRERDAEIAAGANHYTAAECVKLGKVFEISASVTMTVLDQKFYYEEAESENDYSVCTLFTYGDQHFIFTGDLEEDGEESLIEKNDLPKVALYKAGHHGSKTSSSKEFMAVIQPEIVCVCCCAGSSEYTEVNENQFPTQIFVDNVAPYTDKIYVTTICNDYDNDDFSSMNGNITVTATKTGVTVACSASDTLLKDTEWFKKNRTCPSAWK